MSKLKIVAFLFFLIFALKSHDVFTADWRTANREPAGIAPIAENHPEAIVQVYAARAFSWRGYFSVHSWIAIKKTDAKEYKVYQVLGWRSRYNQPVLSIETEHPDRYWFNNRPEVIRDIRGVRAGEIIRNLENIVDLYPYKNHYVLWPGPNSNTFTAWVGRKIPELRLELPSIAIGKDFLGTGFFSTAPSRTGYQVSIFGIFGILLARDEGLEINVAGLVFGVDPLELSLKLPLFGKVGFLNQQ
ncbi:MAG: DUF3750 domain-containing protein [Pseudomonadota bacterium]|nr:DUF3750 domain-containing protein [Pseudomonadota bacterium]MEE3260566.1 DUF3750 domain-containing protein [Pseudomonadota bacterium]